MVNKVNCSTDGSFNSSRGNRPVRTVFQIKSRKEGSSIYKQGGENFKLKCDQTCEFQKERKVKRSLNDDSSEIFAKKVKDYWYPTGDDDDSVEADSTTETDDESYDDIEMARENGGKEIKFSFKILLLLNFLPLFSATYFKVL